MPTRNALRLAVGAQVIASLLESDDRLALQAHDDEQSAEPPPLSDYARDGLRDALGTCLALLANSLECTADLLARATAPAGEGAKP